MTKGIAPEGITTGWGASPAPNRLVVGEALRHTILLHAAWKSRPLDQTPTVTLEGLPVLHSNPATSFFVSQQLSTDSS
jgi:hypothetical protein